MILRDRAIALYGRFSPGERDRLQRDILSAGGSVARDLTRRSDVLVIGALATALVDTGALAVRLGAAQARGVPTLGERGFARVVRGETVGENPTLALSTALRQTTLTGDDVAILAAFDLVHIEGACCGFGDARVIRTAADLVGAGRALGEAVRILIRARDLAPPGRHKIVLTASGAALQWSDGLTSLEGQGLLPLDERNASIEDLFEAAAVAEAAGDMEDAARFYDLCARADRTDAIAPYNLANIRLAQGAYAQAALAYQQALARDAGFIEARYNLAQAREAEGKPKVAIEELGQVLAADPDHPDALFNLAQLRMKAGELAAAKALYERYLGLRPPEVWAQTARKAIVYCTAQMGSPIGTA